jgi:hypothetical protein
MNSSSGIGRKGIVLQVGRLVRVKVKGRVVSWHPGSIAVPPERFIHSIHPETLK